MGAVFLDQLFHFLPILIDGHDWQAQHLLADGQAARLGGVKPRKGHFVAVLGVHLLHKGLQRLAGLTAIGIEIHKHRAGGLQHFCFKGFFGQIDHVFLLVLYQECTRSFSALAAGSFTRQVPSM